MPAAAAKPATAEKSGSGRRRTPSGTGEKRALCDGCQASFPDGDLKLVDGRRLCETCVGARDKAAEHRVHAEGGGPPGSGLHKKPSGVGSGRAPAKVSGAPVVAMLGIAGALGAVAVYFGFIHQGTPPAPVAPPAVTAEDGEATPVERPLAPRTSASGARAGLQKAEKMDFVGAVQPPVRDGSGKLKYLRFLNAETGRELHVTEVDEYFAKTFTEGQRYLLKFKAVPAEGAVQTVKFSLEMQYEPQH